MEEITLNLIPTGVRPTCHVSQNDNERNIKINLVEGSLAYAIKADDEIKLNVRKPDNHVVTATVTGTTGNTYIIVEITDDMCNVDGDNTCEIRIINGSTRLSTSNFTMVVETSPASNPAEDTFAGLADVSFTNLQNGQIPKYNSSTQKWENANGGGGGGASVLDDLDDVTISSPANGQILKYNGTAQRWENGAVFTDLVGTLTAGQTSVTISNAIITTASTVDVYTDVFGVNPTAVSVSNGSVTLTFDAQANDVNVKVRIS